jgi:hypothetical protein
MDPLKTKILKIAYIIEKKMFNINGTTIHPSFFIPIKNLNQLANCSVERMAMS